MRWIIATLAILLTLGCGKGGEADPVKAPEKKTEKAPEKKADKAAEKAPATKDEKAPAKKDEKAAATGTPAGWSEYKNDAHGFSLLTPGSPRDVSDMVKDPRAKVSAFQSMFKDESGMGQLMFVEAVGDEAFDVEAGLDGACKRAVAGIKGTLDKYEKKQDMGRSAREFEFSASLGGENLKGFGRGFALGPRKVGVVFAMYRDSKKATGEAKAKTYVSSFKLK